MIAHNNDHDPDVFQISPGVGRRLARPGLSRPHGQRDVERLRAQVEPSRGPPQLHAGKRNADGVTIPPPALHPLLQGEVRTPDDPRSSLYNTDGQIFSDAGIPVVLFMENYDINRVGYHDTHDNMTNIDLDYGSAVAAIAIESVARAACSPLPLERAGEGAARIAGQGCAVAYPPPKGRGDLPLAASSLVAVSRPLSLPTATASAVAWLRQWEMLT